VIDDKGRLASGIRVDPDWYSIREWQRAGRLSGYPECCIRHFIELQLRPRTLTRAPGHLQGPLRADWVQGNGERTWHGFVPCQYHWEHPPDGYRRVWKASRAIGSEMWPLYCRDVPQLNCKWLAVPWTVLRELSGGRDND